MKYWFASWDSYAERHSFFFRVITVDVSLPPPYPQQTCAVFLTDWGAHTLATIKLVSILIATFVSVSGKHTLSKMIHSTEILKSQQNPYFGQGIAALITFVSTF